MIKENNSSLPLVSVRILTYNSSKYIIETLESVYRQTYLNIELILSDDCSTDDTVTICRNWINEKGSRFNRVVLLTSPVNTGVCANSKRSLEATTGDFIKGLGGDDCLYPQAIEEFVSFMQEEGHDICASQMDYMDDVGNNLDVDLGPLYEDYMEYLKMPYNKQLKLIKQFLFLPGPVLFYSREVYMKTGGPDEKYGTADEWSFIYKTLKAGYRIYGLQKVLVRYRVREGSLCHVKQKKQTPPYYRRCCSQFMKDVILPDLLSDRDYLRYWHTYILYLMWGKSRSYKYLRLADPLWYYEKFSDFHKNI